ncbi:sporulation protein rmd1 [Rhizoctonia solani]
MSSRSPLPTTVDPRISQDTSKPRGANRSTKGAHKLKVLPEQPDPATQSRIGSDEDGDEDDEEARLIGKTSDGDADADDEDAEVYKQIAQIPAGTARKDARKLTKKEKSKLPRVTAYCTAQSYKMDDLMKFFLARKSAYHTAPQLFDEVLYTPYSYDSKSPTEQYRHKPVTSEGDLLGVPELAPADNLSVASPELYTPQLDTHTSPEIYTSPNGKHLGVKPWVEEPTQPEVFLFAYGTVVLWGMTEAQERRFLTSLKRFEVEKLAPDDVEKEDLNYYYANYSRIYNDVITLRRGSSYMTKLSLSHALAQSVKISLFEELIASTIEQTKDIPEALSEAGKIGVLQDMLKLLKESVTSRHGERLEQIVIVLIGIEICE